MTDDIRNLFSKNLSNQLYKNQRTQADLCKRLNVSSATASDWCNGKKLPRLDKIQTICNWLGIEKSDLLEEKDEIKEASAHSAEALEMLELFENADPTIQQFVLNSLRSSQQKP